VNHAIRLAPSALLAATILAGPAFAQGVTSAPAKANPPAANPPAVTAAPAKVCRRSSGLGVHLAQSDL
jgi:hypothetical protein